MVGGLFFGLCLGLHLPTSSARSSPSERPLSWVCPPGRSPRSRGSILSFRRFFSPPAPFFGSPPLSSTDFPFPAGLAVKSARPTALLAPLVSPCVGLVDRPPFLPPGFPCYSRSALRGRTLAPPCLIDPALTGGIPSIITTIMRANFCTGSLGPISCNGPGNLPGSGRGYLRGGCALIAPP